MCRCGTPPLGNSSTETETHPSIPSWREIRLRPIFYVGFSSVDQGTSSHSKADNIAFEIQNTYTQKSKGNSSDRKIYILRLNRNQLRKMQLQGFRLGIEPGTLDL